MKKKKVILIVIAVGIMLVLSYVVGYFIVRNTESYQYAMTTIQNNSEIKETIGTNITSSLDFFGYSIRHEGTKGTAGFKIDIKGSKASGKVFINLKQDAGIWSVEDFNLKLDNGSILKLTHK